MKKILIFVGFLVAAFVITISCNKSNDELRINESFYKISTVSFDSFKKDIKALATFRNFSIDRNVCYKSVDTIAGFNVLKDKVTLIQNGDYKSYTFEVVCDSDRDLELKNLVLTKELDGEFKAYLYEYLKDGDSYELNDIAPVSEDGGDWDINNMCLCYTPYYDNATARIIWVGYYCACNHSNENGSDADVDYGSHTFGENETTGGEVAGTTDDNQTVNDSGSSNQGQGVTSTPVSGGMETVDVFSNSFGELSEEQEDWIWEHMEVAQACANHITQNNNSQTSIEFVKYIMDNNVKMDDIYFSDSLLFDELLSPCEKRIIQMALNIHNNIADRVRDRFTSSLKHNYIIAKSDTPFTDNSIAVTYLIDDYNHTVLTKFDPQRLSTSTELQIATAAFHEAIHALLFFESASNPNLFSNLSPYFPSSFDAYFIGYINYEISLDNSTTQHEVMMNFENEMASSLLSYAQRRNLTNVDLAFCKKMAYAGLTSTTAFQTRYPILLSNGQPNPVYNDIVGTIYAEQENRSLSIGGVTYTPRGQTTNSTTNSPCTN